MGAYKDVREMKHWELNDQPEPANVQITCASANNQDCDITWEKPRWYTYGNFVYNVYLFADFNRAPTCDTRFVLVDEFPGLKPNETSTRSDFDLDPPPTPPTGCTHR